VKGLAPLAAAYGLVLAHAGCQARVAHVFGGYAYNEGQTCLYASGAIDVIAGADPGTCAMVLCWHAPDGSIYVTDQACDAPPDYQDQTNDTSSLCVKALAIYNSPGHGVCPTPDGGAGGSGT
jgi:hypothetical protein